jgi:hypothetical protein
VCSSWSGRCLRKEASRRTLRARSRM